MAEPQIAAAALKDSEYKQAAANQVARTVFRSDNPKERDIGNSIKGLFGSLNGVDSSSLTDDLYKRLKVQYANLLAVDSDSGSVLQEGLKPVSSFIGSTLLNLTGMQEDSTGSKFDLPQTLSSMLEKMNPSIRAKFKSTYESFNAQKLGELPTQLQGNAKQLTENAALSGQSAENSAAGSVGQVAGKVSLPQGLQDAGRGLEDLMGKANDFVNDAIESITKQLTNLVKLIPKEATQLLGQASQFTGQIDGLTKQFGGIEQLKGVTDKLNLGNLDFNNILKQDPLQALQSSGVSFGNFADINQLSSFLKQNPLQAIAQGGLSDLGGIGNLGGLANLQGLTGGLLDKAPNIIQGVTGPLQTGTGVTSGTQTKPSFSLPDPKALIKSVLPQQIAGGLSQLSLNGISGFGFTGNNAFGLEKALEGLGSDVFGDILSKFSGQIPFLASTLAGTAGPNDQPDNYPSNEAKPTTSPDGSTTYVTDSTSGAIIQGTPPKPVYGATGSTTPT
jgi:hypothetical protein